MASYRLTSLNVVLLFVTVAALMFGAYGLFMNGNETARPSDVATNDSLDEFGGGDDGPITGGERSKKKKPDGSPAGNQPGKTKPVSPTGDPDATTKADIELHPTDAVSNPSDRGDAVIEGMVTDGAGTPVSGATVTARRSELALKPPDFRAGDLDGYREEVSEFMAKAARESRTTSSADDGKFVFRGLDGKLAYDLTARTEGATGARERVAAGDVVVIKLTNESPLAGRVETKDGKPVTEFTVSTWPQNRQWEATSRSFEDAEGRFSMPAKSGAIQVEVKAPGFTQDKPMDVQAGPEAKEIVIVLSQAAVLTGLVTDKEGKPLAEVTVNIGEREEGWGGWYGQQNSGSAKTDSKGRYRFDTLPPKETKFTASRGEMSESQTITLVAGENTLDFKMDVGAVLRLHLSDPDGKPIDVEQVWFQEKDNRGWPRAERLPSEEPGIAEYVGLKPGEYTMTAIAAGFPAISQPITVTDGSNELTLKFSKGAMLSGVVTGNNGAKVSNIGVRLRKEDEERWGGWGTGRYAQVAEDGSYKLGPAEPGQWCVEVYATNTWSEVYSGTVTIAEGDNAHNIVIDAGATVTVKLVDEEGNALAWGNAQLQSADKNYNGQSNGEGVATLSFVEVGTYSLIATANGLASPTVYVSLIAGDNPITVKLQKPNCCRVTYVYPDTQASKAGLQIGDVIVEYNSQTITSWGGFGQAVRATKDLEEVTMVVERGGSPITYTLKGGTVGIEGTDGVR
jgi:protocatechuate 3,4-dioxygenase beta subunit